MGLEDPFLELAWADGPKDGDGLGDAEGEVEAGDGVVGGLSVVLLGDGGFAVSAAEGLCCVGVLGGLED